MRLLVEFVESCRRVATKTIEDSRRNMWLPAEGDCFEYMYNPPLGVWLPDETRQATAEELSEPVTIISVDGPANMGSGLTLTLRLNDGQTGRDQYFRKSHARVVWVNQQKRKRNGA